MIKSHCNFQNIDNCSEAFVEVDTKISRSFKNLKTQKNCLKIMLFSFSYL